MKTILFAALVLFSLQGFSEGNSVRNGGDGIAAEFTGIMKVIIADLDHEKLTDAGKEILSKIKVQMDQIEVYSEEKTFLDNGQEVDAINEPALKKITLSRSRWNSLDKKMRQRLQLALHEYASVVGYNDQNYVLSLPLLDSLRFETVAKITSQKDYLLRLERIMDLFNPSSRLDILNLPQACLAAGQVKAEWQSVLQLYDVAWYKDVDEAEFSKSAMTGVIANFERVCLRPDTKDVNIPLLANFGGSLCRRLHRDLIR